METVSKFGERLLKLREERNETQQQLADAVDITRQSLSRYETNDRTPNIDLVYNIAKHYNVSADYLLGLSEIQSSNKKIEIACEVTGLSEKAITHLINFFNDGNNDFIETLSDIISSNSFFEMIKELWFYGEQSLETTYIEEFSEKICEISNNPDYSIELRENFMIKFAHYFDLSSEKIYKDSLFRKKFYEDKEFNEACEQSSFFKNFSIADTFITFLNDSKNSLDLIEYNTIKKFQQLMKTYIVEKQKKYSIFKKSINDHIKNFCYIGFDEDRSITNEEQKFKKYISELFKEESADAEHNPKKE